MQRPLHAQVADELRARIVGGELGPGSAIESEAQLCARFSASRGTVRNALAVLRREGFIGGGQGRRPRVIETAPSQPFEQLISFSAWVRRHGHTPGQRTVEVARRGASATAAAALGLNEGEPVIEVLRVRLIDGHPAMLERSAFIESVGRILFDFDPDSGSIYDHLSSAGVEVHGVRHSLDAVAAEAVDADLLEVPIGSPLLRERHRATGEDGAPLEYGEHHYRPEHVTFTIGNSRPQGGVATNVRVTKEIS